MMGTDQSRAGRAERSFAGGSRVLLLQGPVGPFFSRLQETLEGSGHEVRRVCFHAGDRVFAPRNNRILFNGGADAWREWINGYLTATQIDCIILFGAERPIHQIARAVAQRLGIRVIALEEGYLRPGFVTIEDGGNNATSPIAGCLPPPDFIADDAASAPATDYRSLRVMGWYSTVHYVLRTFSQTSRRKQLFHRRFSALPEIFRWGRNGWRRILHANQNLATIQKLLEHHDGKYFLVPLQVSADANLQAAAAGWCSARLIRETLSSFAKHANPQARLVFKIHPLERGHVTHAPLINATAATLGVAGRVDVVDTGSLGLLARHSAGMITINSTSGLSAIHHGTPLLVIGRAIYANPELAICANGAPNFDAFWAAHHVAAPSVRRNYLGWLRQVALAPGDFYAAEGITLACEAVLTRLGPGLDTLTTHEPQTSPEAVSANKLLLPKGAPLVA
ncbi:hypothetical protein [Phaeovulum sp.]|uniref:capsular polysaccharide export protein, LipB/KpsS family n=1 Tax=Phaeovulum sp. TaxID=2934796 RepID=UPI0039E51DC6